MNLEPLTVNCLGKKGVPSRNDTRPDVPHWLAEELTSPKMIGFRLVPVPTVGAEPDPQF